MMNKFYRRLEESVWRMSAMGCIEEDENSELDETLSEEDRVRMHDVKKDENVKSMRNMVGVPDETLKRNDTVRMHDVHTGLNEQNTVNLVRMLEDKNVETIVRMSDDQNNKNVKMTINPVRMPEDDHDETLTADDTVRMYDVKTSGIDRLLMNTVGINDASRVEYKVRMPDGTLNGDNMVRMNNVQTRGDELQKVNMVEMLEDSKIEPIVRMHDDQSDKYEKIGVNPVRMHIVPKEPVIVNLMRMHGAEYKLNRVKMLDTNWKKTEEDDTMKTVRMYYAHNGNSKQNNLNIVRMPNVKIDGEADEAAT